MKIIKCLSEGADFNNDMKALAKEYIETILSAIDHYGTKSIKLANKKESRYIITADYRVQYKPKSFTSQIPKKFLIKKKLDKESVPELFPNHFPPLCLKILATLEDMSEWGGTVAAFDPIAQEIIIPIPLSGIEFLRDEIQGTADKKFPIDQVLLRIFELSVKQKSITLISAIAHELTHWFDLGRWETLQHKLDADQRNRSAVKSGLKTELDYLNNVTPDDVNRINMRAYANNPDEVTASIGAVVKELDIHKIDAIKNKIEWDTRVMPVLKKMPSWEYYTPANKQKIAKEVYKYITGVEK